jgi:hypothetical protein
VYAKRRQEIKQTDVSKETRRTLQNFKDMFDVPQSICVDINAVLNQLYKILFLIGFRNKRKQQPILLHPFTRIHMSDRSYVNTDTKENSGPMLVKIDF